MGSSDRDEPEALSDVLASIRAVVSAEAEARAGEGGETVLMLTPEMRIGGAGGALMARLQTGEILAEGIETRPARMAGAPILDEEALRDVVNTIVREELQGELGDRISRNLRKLVRREIGEMLDETRRPGAPAEE